ncbi:MAG: FtsL-like putative cell division protein [Bacteroidales bacterium]
MDIEENVEFVEESSEKKSVHRGGSVKDFIDGSVLTRDFVVRQLPFIIFLAILAILYIGNRYHSEKLVRRTSELQNELKELRAEAITVSAELMHMSRQSEVLKLLRRNNLDLVESLEPPRKIVVKRERR